MMEDVTNQLQNILGEYITELNNNLEIGLVKGAEFVAKEISRANPKSDKNTIHMSTLWRIKLDQKTGRAIVYNDGKGSLTHLLEFGTKRMARRPFIQPTFGRIQTQVIEIIKENL